MNRCVSGCKRPVFEDTKGDAARNGHVDQDHVFGAAERHGQVQRYSLSASATMSCGSRMANVPAISGVQRSEPSHNRRSTGRSCQHLLQRPPHLIDGFLVRRRVPRHAREALGELMGAPCAGVPSRTGW